MMNSPARAVMLPAAILAGLLAPGLAAAPVAGGPAGDPLDHPALASPLAPRSLLTAVAAAGGRLVAVGERGHILLSDDAGATWRQAAVPVAVTLTAVRFADARTGWAVGHEGVVLRTDDGGATWRRQLDGRTLARLVLAAVPPGDAVARAEAERLVADGPDKPLFDLLVRSPRDLVVVGAYGLMAASRDGGESWQPALDRLPDGVRSHIYAIRAGRGADAGTLYLAGEQGLLMRSTDGGARFTALDSPYIGSFFDLVTLPGGGILALGLRGNLFRSDDHGLGWEPVALPTLRSLTAGLTLDGGPAAGAVVLLDETGALWISHDRGHRFTRQAPADGFPFLGAAPLPGGGLLAVGARGALPIAVAPPAPAPPTNKGT